MTSERTDRGLFGFYFILTWVISFLVMFGQNAVNGAASVYFGQLGYTSSFTGAATFIFSMLALVFRFVGGSVADAKTRRLALTIGCSIFALSFYLLGVAVAPALLLMFRGMNGAGYAMSNTAVTTANYDVTPEKHRSRGVGIF